MAVTDEGTSESGKKAGPILRSSPLRNMPSSSIARKRPVVVIALAVCWLTIVLSRGACAQNLVPNPSFEDADTCAVQLGYLPNGIPAHWTSFSNTPDYYRSCVPNGSVNGVPQAFLVYQYPFEGESFSGIYTYFFDGTPLMTYNNTFLGIPLHHDH